MGCNSSGKDVKFCFQKAKNSEKKDEKLVRNDETGGFVIEAESDTTGLKPSRATLQSRDHEGTEI